MVKLVRIMPNEVDMVYETVFPMIDEATQYSVGKYTGHDVMLAIRADSMQLWAVLEDKKILSVTISEIRQYPQNRVCRLICCTGQDAVDWFELVREIEMWAKSIGCTHSQAECRPGWKKRLQGQGYTHSHIIMDKALT